MGRGLDLGVGGKVGSGVMIVGKGVNVPVGRGVAGGVDVGGGVLVGAGVPVKVGSVVGVSSGRVSTSTISVAAAISSSGVGGVQPISSTAMNKAIRHSTR
jgi:hypothetical protein